MVNKSATYTITVNDDVILGNAVSNTFTVYLPSAIGQLGKEITIKKIDASANYVNINASGSETIDNIASFSTNVQYSALNLISDNSNWYIR